MDTIILQDNEVLKDQDFCNVEFDTLIRVEGDNVIIDNIFVSSPTKDFTCVIEIKGKNCNINNCRFQEFKFAGNIIKSTSNAVIQHCLFYGGLKTESPFGAVCLGSGNIFYKNRFENFSRDLLLANTDNLIVNNEFINCDGFSLLTGKGNMVGYNLFDGKAKKESSGLLVCETENSIFGNTFLNIQGNGLKCAVSLKCGIEKSFIVKNIFFNCKHGMALGMVDESNSDKPLEVYFQGNYFEKCNNITSTHKNNVGCEKIFQCLNGEDNGLKYDTRPKEFHLDSLELMKKEIVEFTNAELHKMKITQKKKLETIAEEEEEKYPDETRVYNVENDVNNLIEKFSQKLNIAYRVRAFEKIQKAFAKNLEEYRELMKDMQAIMKK